MFSIKKCILNKFIICCKKNNNDNQDKEILNSSHIAKNKNIKISKIVKKRRNATIY